MAIVGIPQSRPSLQRPIPQNAPQQPRAQPPVKAGSKLLGQKFKDAPLPDSRLPFLPPPPEGRTAAFVVRINKVKILAKDEDQFNEAPDVYCAVAHGGEKGEPKENFIVEFEIMQSDWDAVQPSALHAWCTQDKGKYGFFESDVKGFICATFGADDPSQVDGEDVAKVGRPTEQAAAGKLVQLRIRGKKTRDGGLFTEHIWTQDQDQEQKASA